MVQIRLIRSRIIAFVFSLLKKLERIDNSVTDRYSLIAALCGYAEQFVFDLLRKAFLLLGFSIYFLFADASTTEILMHILWQVVLSERKVKFPCEAIPYVR